MKLQISPDKPVIQKPYYETSIAINKTGVVRTT
jgi:hypothetical protein